jgi:hypothetical protein
MSRAVNRTLGHERLHASRNALMKIVRSLTRTQRETALNG